MKCKHYLLVVACFLLAACTQNNGQEPHETPHDKIVNHVFWEVYDALWDTLYNEYVNFEYLHNEDVYDYGYQCLEKANKDSINEVIAAVDSFVQAMGDRLFMMGYQSYHLTYLGHHQGLETDGRWWPYGCDNDYYTLTKIGEEWNCVFFTLQSKKTNKRYLYFMPTNQEVTPKVSELMRKHLLSYSAEDYSGLFVDLRSNGFKMTINELDELLAYFLPAKDTIAYYTQKRKCREDLYALSEKVPHHITGHGMLCDIPCSLLITYNTYDLANCLAHILSGLPNVTTYGKMNTEGGGALTKTLTLIDPKTSAYIGFVRFPTTILSGETMVYNRPLEPDYKIPATTSITGPFRYDDTALEALRHMEY